MADKIQKVQIVDPKVMTTKPELKPYHPLPSLSLDSDALPEIKNWKIGGKYKIELEVEQVSASKDGGFDYPESSDTKDKVQPISARFKIISIKTPNGKFIDTSKAQKINVLKDKAAA